MRRTRLAIEVEVRRRIAEGRYPPGARMPSHRELQAELGASSVTLQRAFDALIEQGYVEPRGAQGTFVARLLPHRSTIAMVFPDEPGRGPWNRYWSTAKRVAEEWGGGDVRFKIYCITGQRIDSAAHRRLCADVEAGVLAGILFINTPFYIADSPIFKSALPRVCLGGIEGRDMALYGYSVVQMSDGDVPARIVRRFAEAGRRRFAAIVALNMAADLRNHYMSLLRNAGLETRTEWWLGLPVDPLGAASARTVAHLLMAGPERQRPDCLLITDDNLVPHATAGVVDAGLAGSGAVDIAAHANYPGPTIAALPCMRFGPDMTEQIRMAVAEVAARAAGGPARCVRVAQSLKDG